VALKIHEKQGGKDKKGIEKGEKRSGAGPLLSLCVSGDIYALVK